MMSRAGELMLAALVASGGVSAMIWWPQADTGSTAETDPIARFLASLDATTAPVSDVAPAPAAEAPAPEPVRSPPGTGEAGTSPVIQTQDDPESGDGPAVSLGNTPAPEPSTPLPDILPGPLDDAGVEFTWMQPGDLAPGSGTGQAFQINYAPGIRFPLEAGRAFANSQVYAPGGLYGSSGGQCDGGNYSYAWRDNFCETRGYSTPMCPTGHGHQGQDIRPATCENAMHWAVAVADGTITAVGAYSVRLTGTNGIRYT